MTEGAHHLLLWGAVGLPLVAALVALVNGARPLMLGLGAACGIVGIAAGLATSLDPISGSGWLVGDRIAGTYLCVVTVVCTMSCIVAPSYLARTSGSFFSQRHAGRAFWTALFLFWSALAVLPLLANLGAAWLVIEATTAASAVLVAHSGRDRALEAGWKYLMLTSLGLAAAFLGIVLMRVPSSASSSAHGLDWPELGTTLAAMPHAAAVTAYVLVMLGLAAKVGWAPLHSWLPDAHSEAPAPVSAMLSAALLPVVMLVAWRVHDAARAALGDSTADAPLLVFGLVSLAMAVPFLWQPLAWKRLLAYSSLEHMGILALAIAFGGRVATVGVVVHVAGHALAKSLGFYASIPLLDTQPHAARHRADGLADAAPATSAAMLVSAATLAGLPPGPLFVSELLIIIGGIQTGHAAVATALALLAALAFLGMLTPSLALLRATIPDSPRRERTRPIAFGTGIVGAGLVVLAGCGWALASSSALDAIARGIA